MDVSPGNSGIIKVNQSAPSSYPFNSTFDNGESVRLEAVPASGYRFDSWGGHLSDATNPTTIVIDCNKKITANFSQIGYTLTMQVSGMGSTNPAGGNHRYENGTVVDIVAIPDSGWQFDSWTGGVSDPDSVSTTVKMESDKTVSANFSQAKHSWWLIGSVIGGLVIIGVIVWLVVRSRTA